MTRIRAVLFNRDRVLVENAGDGPDGVRPVPGAAEALWHLRRHGLRTGVVTARGPLTAAGTRQLDERVDELLGPFDVWAVCPHGTGEECRCRAPEPTLLLWAAGRLCTAPDACALVGDTSADAEAAHRAGARALLLPTSGTRPESSSVDGGGGAQVVPDLAAVALTLAPGRAPGDPGDGDG
ncbi:HAD-IIIA family hydrolase [Streptomyces sp. NPDC052610]|uniref:HAD-IIIA family hydrolase n=1 Tax=Streptomyces sp. NPDC052610 TaxID=3154952 RepID=UPI0034209960